MKVLTCTVKTMIICCSYLSTSIGYCSPRDELLRRAISQPMRHFHASISSHLTCRNSSALQNSYPSARSLASALKRTDKTLGYLAHKVLDAGEDFETWKRAGEEYARLQNTGYLVELRNLRQNWSERLIAFPSPSPEFSRQSREMDKIAERLWKAVG